MSMRSHTKLSHRALLRTSLLAFMLDGFFVVLFTVIGRGSHAREATVAGVWHTAWPFLAALVFMWAVSAAWRRPLSLLSAGIPVWLGTAVLGLCFRVLFTDSTAAFAFSLVTVATLALFLLGWRIVARLLNSLRRIRVAPDAHDRIE